MTKTRHSSLLLEQWKTDKYAAKLVDRSIYYVIGEKVYRLTSEDGTAVSACPEESLFSSQEGLDTCTRIILHCLNVSNSLPQTCCIIVRSPDVLVLLAKYCKDIKNKFLFASQRRLLNVIDIHKNKGEDICSVLPALHCFAVFDTTSAFVHQGKIAPLKLVERNPQLIPILSRVGQER